MYPVLPENFQSSLSFISTQTLAQISVYLPRIMATFVILLLGAVVAKAIRRVVVKVLETMRISSWVKNTPIEHFVQNTETTQKVESLVGSVVYWLIMLVVIQNSVAMLGLDPLTLVLERVLGYILHVFSAVLVLFFGMLLAGVVESVVKATIKSIDGKASRLLGKISSYLVITIFVLAAVSELGIAREFIMILFVGFVAMISLGVGLAIGLGGQDVVRKVLNEWYERTREEVRE